jgi:hypothetical protein
MENERGREREEERNQLRIAQKMQCSITFLKLYILSRK